MKKVFGLFLFFFLVPIGLFARSVETFYGTIEVDEPVLLELIESSPVQRMKKLHQYGISYYTHFPEEYSRYDHSLGVFAILRIKGASLKEQIAGLLHDVSHTVFSHVGDYLFKQHNAKDSYQDSIHEWFLKRYGLEKILKKHGFSVKDILPKNEEFVALEQDVPELCADRIEYNLQGAFHQGFMTKNEVIELLEDLQFVSGKWICTKVYLMKKMVRFALHMTPNCWGSARNYLESQWLSEIVRKAIELKELTFEDVFFGTDDEVWKKLNQIRDPYIEDRFCRIHLVEKAFVLIDPNEMDEPVRLKFRGINPWIKKGRGVKRLTAIDREIHSEYYGVKRIMEQGWGIKELPLTFAYNQFLP